MYPTYLCLLVLSSSLLLAKCQFPTNPGVSNQNSNCTLASLPATYSKIYISSDDPSQTTFQLISSDSCDDNSYVEAILSVASIDYSCGFYALDGTVQNGTCPYPAGTGIEGLYNITFKDVIPNHDAQLLYFVVHSQVTSTAQPQTSTVTITPVTTITEIDSITATDTVTSAQMTITSLSPTTTNTVTVIPPDVTVTATETRTFSHVVQTYTVVGTTPTTTLPCRQPTLCPTKASKLRIRNFRGGIANKVALEARATGNNTYNGGQPFEDGPLTTVTTPPPAIATSTAATSTQTLTFISHAPDSTTTIPNPTPTTTIYTGASVVQATTTLPSTTVTRTRHSFIFVTTTSTDTIIYEQAMTTRPICDHQQSFWSPPWQTS